MEEAQQELQEAKGEITKLSEDLKIQKEKQEKLAGGDFVYRSKLNDKEGEFETVKEMLEDKDLKLEEIEQRLAVQA